MTPLSSAFGAALGLCATVYTWIAGSSHRARSASCHITGVRPKSCISVGVLFRFCLLLDDDICVGGLVHEVHYLQHGARWRIHQSVAQVVVHQRIAVQQVIFQANESRMKKTDDLPDVAQRTCWIMTCV